MKRIVLAGLAAAALVAAGPASAQYYGGGGYGGGYDGGYEQGPRRGWDDEAPRHRRYERRDYRDEFRGHGGPRMGSVCVTSRGSCRIGRPLPHNTPCRCDIPGFGEKRGAVGF